MTPRVRASWLFKAALIFLCLSGIASYVSFVYFRVSERWVSHTQEVRAAVGDVEAALNRAARERLNILLSGPSYGLDSYHEALAQIPTMLERLQNLTRDNPVQANNCEKLRASTDDRIRSWEQSVAQRMQGDAIDIPAMLRQNLDLSSQTSAILEQIRAEESELLALRAQVAQRRFQVATALVAATFISAFLLLYLHYRLLMSELGARERAERAATEAYQRESTLRQDREREVADRILAEQRLASSEKSLRQLSLHLLRTQDEERRRIGRELHDSLGQYLAILKLNLESLHGELGGNHGGSGDEVAKCVRLAEDSMKEVRTISYLLYPPMLEEVGLKSAIPWYLEGFSKRSNIQTTFEIDPGFERLQRDVELALFRVLQEGLTNVHRHSGSVTANIQLGSKDGFAILAICDRGKGIAPTLLEKSGSDWMGSLGVGLRGMNERMRQLGGTLEVSCTENGTTVVARVPMTESATASTA